MTTTAELLPVTDADIALRSAIWAVLRDALDGGADFDCEANDAKVAQLLARHRLAAVAVKAGEGRVLIWSGEHHAYWRPNGAGYCIDGLGAGVYSRAEAERIVAGCDPEKRVTIREIDPAWPILAALAPPATDPTVEALVEALEPFAKLADFYDDCEQHSGGCPDNASLGEVVDLTVGDLRRARAALAALPTEKAR